MEDTTHEDFDLVVLFEYRANPRSDLTRLYLALSMFCFIPLLKTLIGFNSDLMLMVKTHELSLTGPWRRSIIAVYMLSRIVDVVVCC